MKNKTIYIFLGLPIIVIIIIAVILIKYQAFEIKLPVITPDSKTKLQQCPDEWIDNQMPSIDPKKAETQYFILNGERRELDEFDAEWIQKNCSLKKQEVF